MRAVLCRHFGDPSSLEIGEAPEPVAGPGEICIAVAAAGVNYADMLITAGRYQEKPPFPFSPGMEVAGEVVACGAGVEGFAPGDRVMAVLDHGGFAERAVARASDVFHLPDAMDFVSAAGFPVVYGTAYGALTWRAKLAPGETLLVLGAAGGAGLTAVEVGKAMGATVIAAAGGAEKLALARAKGADHAIDYRTEDLRARVLEITGGDGCQAIFDPVGGSAFDTALRCIAWEGRIVVIGFASGTVPQVPANILLVKNCSAIGFYWGSYRRRDPARHRAAFDDLLAWYAAGRIEPHVSQTLPLADAARALETLAARRATGKLVLTVAGA